MKLALNILTAMAIVTAFNKYRPHLRFKEFDLLLRRLRRNGQSYREGERKKEGSGKEGTKHPLILTRFTAQRQHCGSKGSGLFCVSAARLLSVAGLLKLWQRTIRTLSRMRLTDMGKRKVCHSMCQCSDKMQSVDHCGVQVVDQLGIESEDTAASRREKPCCAGDC